MQVRAWSKTDVGCVRRQNEDACITVIQPDRALGMVCDGMGGANAGEVASEMASQIFSGVITTGDDTPEELMRLGLEQANAAVYRHSLSHTECRGMGTTLVAAMVIDDTAYVLNVGDSRAYTIAGGSIRQLTQDHSLVQELVRAGTISPEEAAYHPHRNIITRALGTERKVVGDLFVHRLIPGERLLLCSDGLSNELGEEDLLTLMETGPVEQSCDRLIEAALAHGARDNVTAVVMELADSSEG